MNVETASLPANPDGHALHQPGTQLSAANEKGFRSYPSVVPSHFYRRRWDETRGDEFDSWGHSLWYFETDEEGWPVRQLELYDAGRELRYGPGHSEDRYGSLGQVSLYDSDEDWNAFEITQVEFERVWCTHQGDGRIPASIAAAFHAKR